MREVTKATRQRAIYQETAFDYERRIRQKVSEKVARRKVGLPESQSVGMGIIGVEITQRQCGGFGNVEEVPKEFQCLDMHSVYAAAIQKQACEDGMGYVIEWTTCGCVWGLKCVEVDPRE
ncbi:hypothetical protein Q9L58_005875 [Maublancomyces gigas]|uniref:DNA-directed DNA polymerase n=1 Tax=Discina gigas TaxID=1032678 RepID=A0ABR3GGU8_9PEZI